MRSPTPGETRRPRTGRASLTARWELGFGGVSRGHPDHFRLRWDIRVFLSRRAHAGTGWTVLLVLVWYGWFMVSDRGRLLAAMPLHAITATYGEEGLRERFAAEIAVFSGPEQQRLEEALQLAAELHAADRRQREPYLNHLLRVAIRVISHYGVRDADVVCAALLHDAVEDHAEELASGGQDAALEGLAGRFGPRVAELVGAVTNPEWEPGRDKHDQYREHVAASLERFPWARVIKASDFTDIQAVFCPGKPRVVRPAV